jgi:hypothetical protein
MDKVKKKKKGHFADGIFIVVQYKAEVKLTQQRLVQVSHLTL